MLLAIAILLTVTVLSPRAGVAVILIAWAISFGWLVKREFLRTTGDRMAEAALAVPPGSVYFRLDLAGHQVGFASTTVDTIVTALHSDSSRCLPSALK